METIPLFKYEGWVPTQVGGLALDEVHLFPDPRLGVQIRYGTPTTAKVDAYLYDLGMSDIPNDVRSPQLIELFQGACQGVATAAEQGMYVDLEVLTSQYLRIPPEADDPFCLWASFTYRQVAGPGLPEIDFEGRRFSHLALRSDRGYINKVRYTCPEGSEDGGFNGFMDFLVEWTDYVRKTSSSS